MRLFRDQRGTSLLEAALAVPVLAVVLVGVVALNAMYSAKLEAKSRARRLAWLQADSGACPPRTCAYHDCEASVAELESTGIAKLESVRSGKLSLDSFLGNVRDFFIGRATRGAAVASASLPRLLGANRSLQRGATVLLCNTTSRDAGEDGSVLAHACATGLETAEYAREVCR